MPKTSRRERRHRAKPRRTLRRPPTALAPTVSSTDDAWTTLRLRWRDTLLDHLCQTLSKNHDTEPLARRLRGYVKDARAIEVLEHSARPNQRYAARLGTWTTERLPEIARKRTESTLLAIREKWIGLTRIAKQLNAEGHRSPRGGTGSWAGTAIRDMLRRSLYAGVVVWNKSQKITRAGTKGQRRRQEGEWLTRPMPELAIVDADLWQRVQARRASVTGTFLRRMDGKLIGRPSGSDVVSPICSVASRRAPSAAARSWQ